MSNKNVVPIDSTHTSKQGEAKPGVVSIDSDTSSSQGEAKPGVVSIDSDTSSSQGEAKKDPLYKIRILAVKVANDDGSQPTPVSPNGIENLVNRANEIYEISRVQFLFDKQKDIVSINNTEINQDITILKDLTQFTSIDEPPPKDAIDQEIHKRAKANFAKLFKDRLTVFFHYGSELVYDNTLKHWKLRANTISSSSWAARYVSVVGNPGGSLLAHECGHYLQNGGHTFWYNPNYKPLTVEKLAQIIKKYVEDNAFPKNAGLDVFDGDRVLVRDTPPDVTGEIFSSEGLSSCGNIGQISIPVEFTDGSTYTYTLEPDRWNVMSYFNCSGLRTLSKQQIRRMRDGLEHGMRHYLISIRSRDLQYVIESKGTKSAGTIDEVQAIYMRAGRVATVVKTNSSKLKIIIWDVDLGGARILRRGSGGGQVIKAFSACNMGHNMIATAIKSENDILRIYTWIISESGDVLFLDSASVEGKLGSGSNIISACSFGIKWLATAIQTESGYLKIIIWHIDAGGKIEMKTAVNGGLISKVFINSISFDSIMTSVVDYFGQLTVTNWRYLYDENKLEPGTSIQAGWVNVVSSSQMNWDLSATTLMTGSSKLKIIAWEHSDDFQLIARLGDASGGTVSAISSCRFGIDVLATAISTKSGYLKIILWELASDGNYIVRKADALSEKISKVSICSVGENLLVTAVKTESEHLKLICWEIK
jgi:hypothetical protein